MTESVFTYAAPALKFAIDWARAQGPWDALVAVGGGSSIDILCHALESYTARPFTSFDRRRPAGIFRRSIRLAS